MASSKQPTSSTKQRAQGGGRTSNSEPRLQTFKGFAGCNFQDSPRSFTLGVDSDTEEQSDLAMNYVVVQNNVSVTNMTLESRNNMVELFSAPDGKRFTDASILIGREMYIATEDGGILYGNLGGELTGKMTLNDKNPKGHHWESFVYADNKIIAATQENQLWTGDLGSHALANAKRVADPGPLTMSNLVARGTLKISASMTDECCFRTGVAYSYVNKFGPTKCSRQMSFWSNTPVSEWHSGCFLQIAGTAPTGYDIKAVEIYYNVDNASSLVFAGRADMADGGSWTFNWIGYLDVTSMWPMANLISPTENYTEGAPVSRMKCIDGRMYFWGSKDEPYRLYIGGNPGSMFSVSPGTTGGFVDVEPGTGQEIRVVDKYKTQSGNSIVTMLCDCNNSAGEQRFNLVENTVTISNEQSMKSWQAEQVAGAVGCKSWHGARVCEDGLYSISRYGLALTTMTMEYNSQIRTNYVSDPIKPIFTDPLGNQLSNAVLLEADGVLYLTLGNGAGELDNLMFCYDIDAKAWWSITLDVDEPVIDMLHVDYEGFREGIGIVTPTHIYLMPTTQDDPSEQEADFEFLVETGELSAQQPQQSWIYLSQLEFHFDHFIGDMEVELVAIDQFGRKVKTVKKISHDAPQFGLVDWMRVDLRVANYKLTFRGKANFRMSHFIARVYTMSAKVGQVWGFNDSQSYRTFGDIHPTFKDYNDVRDSIVQ